MNYAVLLAPDFALQALRRAEPALRGKAVALAQGEGRKARLAEVSCEATTVEPGLAVTLAMARCPGLIIRTREPNAEAEANRLMLAAAFTLSPRVESTSDGCCTVDLQGADRRHTEAQMHAGVAELAAAGLVVRIGAGATPLLASFAARRTNSVLLVDDPREFLAGLPVALAEPISVQADVLRGWGIATLGQLTALAKAEIGRRLGTDGVRLWERAAGETTRVLRLVEPAKTFAAEWTYEMPVESMEPLLFRLQRFAECVALELRGAGFVAEKLALTLLLEDESDYRRDFRLPEPGANVDGWMRVLHGHLENVRTEARVAGVRLVATPARPAEKQDGLFDTGLRDPVVFWENLARLGALVGDDRVGTPVVSDTWRPDAVALEKPAEVVLTPEAEPVHPPRGLTLRRFRPPWPARVDAEGASFTKLDSDVVAGAVRAARGPFRFSGEWWRPGDAWAVEVWHVELQGGAVYQVARTAAGWAVEGVFD